MPNRLLTTRELLVLLSLGVAVCVGALSLYVHHRAFKREALPPPIKVISPGVVVQEDKSADPPQEPAKLVLPNPAPSFDTASNAHSETLIVSAAGAVLYPGAYELDAEARVEDLIEVAGGLRPDADISDINLAARLIDGSTLTIPVGPTARLEEGKLIGRRGQPASLINPPQYTISGWRPEPASAVSAPQTAPGSPTGVRDTGAGLIDLNRATADELESLPGIGPKLAQEIIVYRSQTPFHTVDDITEVKGIGPKRLESIRPFVTVN